MSLVVGIPQRFHDQFAAYIRIEPRCRTNDWAKGLQARTADPLWMLARQWQTGEFQGEDAGSPIEVRLTHSIQTLDRLSLGDDGTVSDIPNAPLEAIIEQERFELNWRVRVQIGQQFERFARIELGASAQTLIIAYRTAFPVAPPNKNSQEWIDTDSATMRYLEFMADRVIDGKELLLALDDGGLFLPDGITDEQLVPLLKRFEEWRNKLWLQPLRSKSDAWRNQRLDYRFDLNPAEDSTTDKTNLKVTDYRNGALDWYTFLMENYIEEAEKWTQKLPIKTHPTRVAVGGTSPRWWAFEDAVTDFGKLDVAKPDLAKLLLMEFVLIYGDDWFSVPVPVPMVEVENDTDGREVLKAYPKLVRIDSLNVSNVFGEDVDVVSARKPAGDPLLRWEMFTLAPADAPRSPALADVLLIPPVAGFREESSPIEEVRFLRDEGANMVWGVEHLIPNGLGRPIDGFDAQRERAERRIEAEIERLENDDLTDEEREALASDPDWVMKQIELLREGASATIGGTPRYRLASTVPENWIPFVPTNASTFLDLRYSSIRLRRAQMLLNADAEDPEPIPAMSRILDLSEDPLLWLEEATVPRSGLRAILTAQRVRWVDGKTYVWLGRKVTTGRGEGSSGLKFDFYEDK